MFCCLLFVTLAVRVRLLLALLASARAVCTNGPAAHPVLPAVRRWLRAIQKPGVCYLNKYQTISSLLFGFSKYSQTQTCFLQSCVARSFPFQNVCIKAKLCFSWPLPRPTDCFAQGRLYKRARGSFRSAGRTALAEGNTKTKHVLFEQIPDNIVSTLRFFKTFSN